jgi:hypothetical protein
MLKNYNLNFQPSHNCIEKSLKVKKVVSFLTNPPNIIVNEKVVSYKTWLLKPYFQLTRTLFLLVFILVSFSLFSQSINSSSVSHVDDIKNRFYIRGGFSTPSWKYYGYTSAQELTSSLGVESKIGANFEVGSIYMLNKIKLSPGLRFGINVDYFSFKAQIFNLPGTENIYNLFIGSKVGPSLTFMPEKGLSFDIFAKLNPIWVAAIYYNKQDFDSGIDSYLGYVQMMYSFGVNVKLAFLMVGFEYEIGSLKLKNINEGKYWGDHSDPTSQSTPMPGFNLTLGLSF